MKPKKTLFQILALFCIELIILLPVYTASALTITNVHTNEITQNSAKISWATDNPANGRVDYGVSSSLGSARTHSDLLAEHELTLRSLSSSTQYLFSLESRDNTGATQADDNSGQFYSFTTLAAEETQTAASSGSSTINVEIPEFFNQKSIDIIGTTVPGSEVKLFVNNLNTPERFLDASRVADGNFKFLNVVLQKENVIKITSKNSAGNEVEKTFRVSVDTDDPEVVLDSLPNVTTEQEISIVGTVDESVTVDVFLIKDATFSTPEKISGLKAVTGINSVQLEWGISDDEIFSHYIVYKNDVPIATIEDQETNSYSDLLVNSGATYTYQVSVMNILGRESSKSIPATATIPSGGDINNPNPEPVDTSPPQRIPELNFETSGSFSDTINLGADGNYALIIEFTDRAENKVVFEKQVAKDTSPPEIEIIKPARGTSIYENYANQIDIEGKTEPNAEVHLFVQRIPIPPGFIDQSFDISGLPNNIENIPETKLRADCRLSIGGNQFCPTAADFSTIADDEGRFFFDNVDLTSIIAGSVSVRQEPLTDFGRTEVLRDAELRANMRSSLVFIATDNVGLRGAKKADYNIINCWSGNQTWDINPLRQTPGLISTERLAEGTEGIQFLFDYQYMGRGQDGFIDSVSVTRACSGTELLADNRFNTSCAILPPGAPSVINPDGTKSYTELRLNRLPQMDRWLQDDWENFFETVGDEITFPLKVTITYKHKVNGREVRETQTTCQEVSYLVDNSRIDPRDVLPDFLLTDFVSFLDGSVDTLNEVNAQVKRAVEFVAFACVGSFIVRLGWQAYRRFISLVEEKKFIVKSFVGIDVFEFPTVEDQEYCKDLVKNVMRQPNSEESPTTEEDPTKEEIKLFKLKLLSDSDLKKCYPKIASAWNREATLYKSYRFSCDRIFGHATPSRWTENFEDDVLFDQLQQGQTCNADEAVFGKPLIAEDCRKLIEDFPRASDKGVGQKCFRIREKVEENKITKNIVTLYELGRSVGGDLYELKFVEGPSQLDVKYAVKKTDTSYLTNIPQTCQQLCTGKPDAKLTENLIYEDKPIPFVETAGSTVGQKTGSLCATSNACLKFATEGELVTPEKIIPIESTTKKGYSSDCFPPNKPLESVSDNPEQRIECCCLNTAGPPPPTVYYLVKDTNIYTSPDGVDGAKDFAFESKTNPDQEPDDFDDIKWSYRYWKERYQTFGIYQQDSDDATPPASGEGTTENPIASTTSASNPLHFEYNPDRYIEGRDFSSCFGQNSWRYDGFRGPAAGEVGNLLTIDPATQHISAFQCLHIAGISNRLTLLSNLMGHLSGCLQDIREDGTSDSAVCKELFTRYVCSSMWTMIQWFQNSCSPFGQGINFDKSENAILSHVSGGVKSVFGAVSDSQQELQEEYGNAQLNNLLGAGEEAVARKVCLAAFGYDWEFSISDVTDIAYATPFATLVTSPTRTREFLTIDPVSAQSKYEYRASWLINPGCDLDSYRVDLACVGANQIANERGVDCSKINDPGGNNCDCKNLPNEQIESFFSSQGRLAQNVLEDNSWDRVIADPFRFDHVKFTLRPDRRIKDDLRESCFPDGHFNGNEGVFYEPIKDKTISDLVNCQIDATTGMFRCGGVESFWGNKGTAYFLSETINGQVVGQNPIVVGVGDPITIGATIYKAPGAAQCLVAEAGDGSKEARLIDIPGQQQYSLTIVPSAEITRGSRVTAEFVTCEYSTIGDTNNQGNQNRNPTTCQLANRDREKLIISLISGGTPGSPLKLRFEDNDNSGTIEVDQTNDDLVYIDGDSNGIAIARLYDADRDRFIIPAGNKGDFRLTNVGFNSEMKSVEYSVNVPSTSSSVTSDRLTVKYGIYNIKDGETNCADYNVAELIRHQGNAQQRTEPIEITSEATARDKPVISNIMINGATSGTVEIFPDRNLKISVEVTHNKPVKVNFDLSRITNGAVFNVDEEIVNGEPSGTYSHTYQLSGQGGAGLYQIEIDAKDNDGKRTRETKAIDVGCFGNNFESAGQCRRDNELCDGGIVIDNNLDLSCQSGFKCCRVS